MGDFARSWFRRWGTGLNLDLMLSKSSEYDAFELVKALTELVTRTPPFAGLAFLASYSTPVVSSRSEIAPFSANGLSSRPDILMPFDRADVREATEGGGRDAVD